MSKNDTVPDVVAAYRAGEMTLDQLASNIAGRTWPPIAKPASFLDAYNAAEDTDYFRPGTWNGDVARLEHDGTLTPDEYDTILAAKEKAGGR